MGKDKKKLLIGFRADPTLGIGGKGRGFDKTEVGHTGTAL